MPQTERYAIISDIHGNLAALEATLRMADEYGAHEVCCLGDIVGYGAAARECVELVRGRCRHIVRGNHDAKVRPPRGEGMRPEAEIALEYAAQTLTEEQILWLANLPHPQVVNGRFILAHGALTAYDDYILKQEDVRANIGIMTADFPGRELLFFGHTHLPMALTASGAKTDFRAGGLVSLAPGKQYLVNPGSVGQPRDGNPAACFCIYDAADGQVIFLRAEYDIDTEQERMRAAGLPDKSIRRIALGR